MKSRPATWSGYRRAAVVLSLAVLAGLIVNALLPVQIITTSATLNRGVGLVLINTPVLGLLITLLIPNSEWLKVTRWLLVLAGVFTMAFTMLLGRVLVRHLNDKVEHDMVSCGSWRFWHVLDTGAFAFSGIYQRVEARRRVAPGLEIRRVLHVKPAGQTEITIIPFTGCDSVLLVYSTMRGDTSVVVPL